MSHSDDQRHADGATVIMTVTAANTPKPKPAAAVSPERILYFVRATGEQQWEVAFGDSGTTELYPTRADAVFAARAAARDQWTTHGRPSRVTLEIDGVQQMCALYGMDIPAPSPSAQAPAAPAPQSTDSTPTS